MCLKILWYERRNKKLKDFNTQSKVLGYLSNIIIALLEV